MQVSVISSEGTEVIVGSGECIDGFGCIEAQGSV